MLFDKARLDAGDLTYLPGVCKVGASLYWRCTKKDAAAGYSVKTVPLGKANDGQGDMIVRRAHSLTRDLMRWRDGLSGPKVEPGTWHWLIARYRSDDVSPYREVKPNTRVDYDVSLNRWVEAIGDVLVADCGHGDIKRWQIAMEAKGRSLHYIRAMFTKMRIVVGYGVMIEAAGANRLRDILGEMRFRAGGKRQVQATEAHVMAVVESADEAQDAGFALGALLQWWLTLRAVDVRGQWFTEDGNSRWADGLTWDMIDLPLIRKVPSKTARSMPDAIEWDLTPLPEVIARLEAIPTEQRVGPVIRQSNGRPFTQRLWAAHWRKHAQTAGVPDHVTMMDIRSGAMNHARSQGADLIAIRNQANHANASTTDRYMRGRQDDMNRVIELRRTKTQQP
jgi:hypothetical protein